MRENVRAYVNKAKNERRSAFMDLGPRSTPGKVDMGYSKVPISSLRNVRKCEKM